MPVEIDKELLKQVRAAKRQPRNFFFVPGKDGGELAMSRKKLDNKAINEAKKKTGSNKVIKGRVLFVDGVLTFQNVMSDDKSVETKIRKTIKQTTGLAEKVALVKAENVKEIEEDDDTAQESDKVSETEKAVAYKAVFKKRHNEVARKLERLRELDPNSASAKEIQKAIEKLVGHETEAQYKKGVADLDALDEKIDKAMPQAENLGFSARALAAQTVVAQLRQVDNGAAVKY